MSGRLGESMILTSLKSNPLSSRHQLAEALSTLLAPLDGQFTAEGSGLLLGDTCAHYGPKIAEMEGLSRALWGLFPLMASGLPVPEERSNRYIEAIKRGTDPTSDGWWGNTGPYDQRLVEMAVYGLGLALLGNKLTAYFSAQELHNLWAWLGQVSDAQMPDSNWHFFAIMVQLGFKQAGLDWDPQVCVQRFAMMDAYYLGNGWYSDGPGRPKDYYISMAFHYYGLIYATLMGDDDRERAETIRQRARQFARDFIYMSAPDGASIPFGRSLTYRFTMIAFWSAVAWAELDILPVGQLKGLILRHLRWWFSQSIFDRDGILTLGYAYPNLVMCEDYNSPGSPYWALKVFLILAIPEDAAFWRAEEAALPPLAPQRPIPEAQQLVVHPRDSQHAYLLTAGQLELNNYVNTEAKYTKFAYHSRYGFTVERGRYGIKHAACDSMLLLADGDNYYRGRRDCGQVTVTENAVYSRWSPWQDVDIETWLIPAGQWHIRVHRLVTQRALQSVEGGYGIIHRPQNDTLIADGKGICLSGVNGQSAIVELSSGRESTASQVVTPPNSSIMFAECAAIPILARSLAVGTHWLACAVAADDQIDPSGLPGLELTAQAIRVYPVEKTIIIPLSF